VLTDSLGNFEIPEVTAGTYTLEVEKDGFQTAFEPITVVKDQVTQVVIQLEPRSDNNQPPGTPHSPTPPHDTTGLEVNLSLHWRVEDPDDSDLSFDVYIFPPDGEPYMAAAGTPDTFALVENLLYDRSYQWQVVVHDGDFTVFGPVWRFRTRPFPDHRFLFVRQDGGFARIYSSDEHDNAVPLTPTGVESWRPRLSPIRHLIAFLRYENLEPHLFVMNRDGSQARRVSPMPVSTLDNAQLDFCWEGDGQHLLFVRHDRLYRVRTDGTELTQLAVAPSGWVFTACDYSATTQRIVVRQMGSLPYQSSILLLEPNGTPLKTLVDDPPGSTGNPAFSPDGRKILYTQDVSGNESPDGRQFDARIFLYDLELGTLQDLSVEKTPGTNDLEPRFSPTGAQVIFTNTPNDGLSPRHIYVMDLQGMNRTLLFPEASMPDWR